MFSIVSHIPYWNDNFGLKTERNIHDYLKRASKHIYCFQLSKYCRYLQYSILTKTMYLKKLNGIFYITIHCFCDSCGLKLGSHTELHSQVFLCFSFWDSCLNWTWIWCPPASAFKIPGIRGTCYSLGYHSFLADKEYN